MSDLGNVSGSSIDKLMGAADEISTSKVEIEAQQDESMSGLDNDWRDNFSEFASKRAGEKYGMKDRKPAISRSEIWKQQGARMPDNQELKNKADQYQTRNPELKSRSLVLLRQMIKPDDTPEEILRKAQDLFGDISLVDEALDYLLETSEGELHDTIQLAKEQIQDKFGREIAAGRNIGQVAREASAAGLGAPSTLRDLYRDITANPRESNALFNELNAKFNYNQLKQAIDFLLHSVGADLKSSGPSIPRGLLHNLLQETRSLQAILGVYSFFKGRMALIQSLFAKNGIPPPKELTFEQVAKQFMALVGDRYPSGDKVLQTAAKLGIDKSVMAKIIVLSQLRDAIREVALPQVYRSVQHRDELSTAIISALETLEEELEELLGEVEGEADVEFEEEDDAEDF